MSGLYAIVVCSKDNSVCVVPAGWLDDNTSYWAPYKSQQKFDWAVKMAEKLKQDWKKFPVRILGIKGNMISLSPHFVCKKGESR
jgi:hypothetical protein